MNADNAVVVAQGLCASFGTGRLRVPVLEDASFEIARGGVTALSGPSGSGKTTLLSLIGGLARPQGGSLVVDGEDLTAMSRTALAAFRRSRVGFVFQSFALLPTLTARENVEAALEPLRLGRATSRARARDALAGVGLAELGHRFPDELSGGEQQRVAVARAVAKAPTLLLADEPTGNLDDEASDQVMDVLIGAWRRTSTPQTLIVVTHDPHVAERADAVLSLRAGGVHPVSS